MKHLFTIAALALALCLPLAGPVAADQFEDGLAAYNSGDYATALNLWQPLADQGYPIAQNNLGVIYEHGEGVPHDDAEAVKWYRLAADQGYAIAQNNLGIMYAAGRGVPQDYVRAHMWFSLSASSGDMGATDDAAKNRDRAASLMTPEQLAEAERLAQEWKPKQP